MFRDGEQVLLFLHGDPPRLVAARQAKRTIVQDRVRMHGSWVSVDSLATAVQAYKVDPARV